MKHILYLFKQSHSSMILVSLASIGAGLSGAALVAVVSKAVLGDYSREVLALLFFGLCIVFVILKSFSEVTLLKLTQKFTLNLRVSLSEKILATSQLKMNKIGSEGLMVILTRDIENFSNAFQATPNFISSIIVIAACSAYMALLSVPIFIMFVIVGFLCVGGYIVAEQKPLRQLQQARERLGALFKSFRGLVYGSRELQLNKERSEYFVERVIKEEATECAKLIDNSMSAYTWTSNIGNILFYQAIGVLLFVFPYFLSLEPAIVTESTLVMIYLVRPISEILKTMPSLRQASISFNKIQELDYNLNDEQPKALPLDPFNGGFQSLKIDNVYHQYPSENGEAFKVGPISLEISKGETLFIIGGNGAGKTSLAMLVLGLFQAESGDIQLNGVPVTKENIINYRQYFSAIFADGHLFEHLPRQTDPDTQKRAEKYIELLGLMDKVKIEDGRFSTISLSTGQRKRLALVSSYIEDRPIYVFDEWAADQDPEFKRVFYTEILADLKSKGKAVIIITHDDAYFSLADHRIKLVDGMLHSIDGDVASGNVVYGT